MMSGVQQARKLAQIVRLAESRYLSAKADYGEIAHQVHALEDQVEELRQKRNHLADNSEPQDAAMIARHEHWIVQQIKNTNIQLAQLRADQEEARATLNRMNGERLALKRISGQR